MQESDAQEVGKFLAEIKTFVSTAVVVVGKHKEGGMLEWKKLESRGVKVVQDWAELSQLLGI